MYLPAPGQYLLKLQIDWYGRNMKMSNMLGHDARDRGVRFSAIGSNEVKIEEIKYNGPTHTEFETSRLELWLEQLMDEPATDELSRSGVRIKQSGIQELDVAFFNMKVNLKAEMYKFRITSMTSDLQCYAKYCYCPQYCAISIKFFHPGDDLDNL